MQRAPLHGDGPEDVDGNNNVPRFGDRADNVAAVLHHGTEIDQLDAIDQMAGIGQREQTEVTHQRREPVEIDRQLGGQTGVVWRAAFVAQAQIDRGAHGRNRRLELMRRVGGKPPRAAHRAFETIEHVVQGLHEAVELFAAGAHVETFFEATGLDRADAPDDGIHRSQRPTRDEASAIARRRQHEHEHQQHGGGELAQPGAVRFGRRGHLNDERCGAGPLNEQRRKPERAAGRIVDAQQAVDPTRRADSGRVVHAAERRERR